MDFRRLDGFNVEVINHVGDITVSEPVSFIGFLDPKQPIVSEVVDCSLWDLIQDYKDSCGTLSFTRFADSVASVSSGSFCVQASFIKHFFSHEVSSILEVRIIPK